MAISSTVRKAGPFSGNGVATQFSFSFKVFDPDDVAVLRACALGIETRLVVGDYVIALNEDQNEVPGGVVTLAAPLATGCTLVLLSDVPTLQPVDVTNQGGFYPELLNDGLDRSTIQVQQVLERLGRAITLPATAEGFDLALPLPAPGQLIGWSDGRLVNYGTEELVSVVTYGATLVDKFDGNGSQTSFSLTASPGAQNNLRISIDGVVQVPGDDFTWAGGTTLSFVAAPPAGTRIVAQYQEALADITGAVEAGAAAGETAGRVAGAAALLSPIARRARVRPAEDYLGVGPYDVTYDVLKARAVPGFNGDDAPALNAALAAFRDIVITPLVGALSLKTTVFAPLANTRIVSTGGLQAVPWVRDAAHVGSTLVIGSADGSGPAAGACHLENLWFVHPDRLGFVTMAQNGGNVALPNVLTGGQSHIEVHGAQNGYARVGGYGCVHFASTFGGAGMLWDNPFIYGGVWDPGNPLAQEAISHFRLVHSAAWGHGTNHAIRTPHLYGGNATAQATATPGVTAPLRRPVVIGNKTVQVSRRIGPKFGILIESCEDVEVSGGFSAGYAIANLAYLPVVAGSYTCNVILKDHKIDESNVYGVYARRPSADVGRLDTLKIQGCTFNGQLIGERAIFIDGDNGLFPVQRLEVKDNVFRAYLGGVIKLTGADGGELSGNTYAGYNASANNTGAGGSNGTVAILIDGLTRNMKIERETFGGGINFDTETNAVDAYGVSPNGTQWGMIDATPANNNNRYHRLRARKIGGAEAWGIAGGGVVLGGNLDNGS